MLAILAVIILEIITGIVMIMILIIVRLFLQTVVFTDPLKRFTLKQLR